MTRRTDRRAGLLLALGTGLLLAGAGVAVGHDGTPHEPQAQGVEESVTDAKVVLHDIDLVDSTGATRRLVADVLDDRIVVVDFFFTTCGTVCPLNGALLSGARVEMGEAVGRDVYFVSISTDPNTDTPERIAEYKEIYGADAGWTVLTGNKENVDRVLEGFGAYTTNPEDHPSMTLVGDVRSGRWVRLFGLPEPERIIATVQEFIAARSGSAERKE